MNKSELVQSVADSANLSRGQAESAVNAFVDAVIAETKRGQKVSLLGFGNFVPTARAARMGRNPQTGAPVKIAASKSVRFAPGAAFKDALMGRSKAAPKKAAGKKAATKKATAKKAPAKKAAKSAKKR